MQFNDSLKKKNKRGNKIPNEKISINLSQHSHGF